MLTFCSYIKLIQWYLRHRICPWIFYWRKYYTIIYNNHQLLYSSLNYSFCIRVNYVKLYILKSFKQSKYSGREHRINHWGCVNTDISINVNKINKWPRAISATWVFMTAEKIIKFWKYFFEYRSTLSRIPTGSAKNELYYGNYFLLKMVINIYLISNKLCGPLIGKRTTKNFNISNIYLWCPAYYNFLFTSGYLYSYYYNSVW